MQQRRGDRGRIEYAEPGPATPKDDANELFRRMCFNALISNQDDHLRNHALIARGAA